MQKNGCLPLAAGGACWLYGSGRTALRSQWLAPIPSGPIRVEAELAVSSCAVQTAALVRTLQNRVDQGGKKSKKKATKSLVFQ